jgi:hypothetical protein
VKNITVVYWNSSEESVKTGISEDGVILFWGSSGGDSTDRERGCSGGYREGRSYSSSNKLWGRLLGAVE